MTLLLLHYRTGVAPAGGAAAAAGAGVVGLVGEHSTTPRDARNVVAILVLSPCPPSVSVVVVVVCVCSGFRRSLYYRHYDTLFCFITTH
ncbi:unnamed protein product [Haemonchus placei]|uniref:Secreted peptide n=1 Tax=Haemonchus placei TaxID=6290 RepID=A0A0N4W8L3_HAEPC|nr:unnamed protein product [Haemonchus placei]